MQEPITAETPLMQNEFVQELYKILAVNNPESCGTLLSVLSYIGSIEQQLDLAVGELQSIRQELAAMQEPKDSPIKTALKSAAQKMDSAIQQAKTHLKTLKASVIQGAKNAVTAFKENGAAALHNIFEFIHIKDGLHKLSGSLQRGINSGEQGIANIRAASTAYHEAGRQVKNIGRAMAGKDAIETAKPMGRLAKIIQAPLRGKLYAFTGIVTSVDTMVAKLEHLEQEVTTRNEVQAEAPAPNTEMEIQEPPTESPAKEPPASDKTPAASLKVMLKKAKDTDKQPVEPDKKTAAPDTASKEPSDKPGASIGSKLLLLKALAEKQTQAPSKAAAKGR